MASEGRGSIPSGGLFVGGTESVRALGIRSNPEEDYAVVETLATPQKNRDICSTLEACAPEDTHPAGCEGSGVASETVGIRLLRATVEITEV